MNYSYVRAERVGAEKIIARRSHTANARLCAKRNVYTPIFLVYSVTSDDGLIVFIYFFFF